MSASKKRIAVIGGGISGLACAYRLTELKKEFDRDFEILLFESASRLGGTIETEKRDGFILEKGADSFISEKPYVLDLCKRLGMESKVISTQDQNRKAFVAQNDKLLELPEGFYLIAPSNPRAFLGSPLFSLSGKLRVMMEPFIPKRKSSEDESVGSFIRRRFGRETLERVGQPMMAGIYAGDPDVLSLQATMPRFHALEKKYGSVILGLLESKRGKKEVRAASGPRYSLFLTMAEGMEVLTSELAKRLSSESIHLNAGVSDLSYDAASSVWRWTASGRRWEADAVCVATSALQARRILQGSAPKLSEKLSGIAYESVITVNLAYRATDIRHPLNGFGFVVPAIEKKSVLACTFCHQKFKGRAPEGYALLRAFAGGFFGKETAAKEDLDLVQAILGDLETFLGIQASPFFSNVTRYEKAMTQYRVGHQALVAGIKEELQSQKRLFLTGSAYEGLGIPDCIRDAGLQAENICYDLFGIHNQIENPAFFP